MVSRETVLDELSGSDALHRVLVVHFTDSTGSYVELRQQSWGEGIGWFTQSSVRLEPQQFRQLRLLGGLASARTAAPQREPAPQPAPFRVLRAESA